MRIELDKLEKSGNSFEHTFAPAEIDLDDDHARLLTASEVSVRVARIGHEVRLRGKIITRAEVDCDRCLKSVMVPIINEFDVKYLPTTDYAASDAAELQEEDLNFSFFEGNAIDIDELVREQVLLALPARALCSEECKGLCPGCGIDRNAGACNCESVAIDPRWAGLEGLVNRES